MRRRILQIIPSLDRAGAEKQMSLLARGLPQDEFEVHVCALTRGGPLEAELRQAGIPVYVIGKRWRADPQAYWRLRRLIAQLRPDLVHTWLFAANAYGRQAAFACRVPVVVASERCVDPWKGTLERLIDLYLARKTARIVVNSQAVRDFYVRYGLPAEKMVVIPNGVGPAQPSPVSRRELLAELGLPENCYLVGLIGRLWPQKRIKDAIWAADLLKVVRDDVHLLIIGDGPQRARLVRFRDQCHIQDKVHFLGHREDVPRLLPHLDVVWCTSAYEGQSNALMEAMAAGVPVVATDIAPNRELIEPGRTGLLFPVGDRASLARYTQKLLEDQQLASRLGQAAAEHMRQNFSVQTMLTRYAQLYRNLFAPEK